MLGAILGGAQIVGGVAGFIGGRKEAKWGRRKARRAEREANERLENMDSIIESLQGERGISERLRNEDIARYDNLGFDEIEQNLANQVREGIDIEGRAETAGNEFANQYDVSLDAQRRAMLAQGVRPGSSAAARLSEDAAFDRARGTASEANTARRHADDQNFARQMAFSQQGRQLRADINNQGANIVGQYRGEYGMQGEIRGQYLNERNHQQNRAQAGREAMYNAGAQIGMGALGGAAGGLFGGGAQAGAQSFIRGMPGIGGSY